MTRGHVGLVLRVAAVLWWPVLAAHWTVRELFGGNRAAVTLFGVAAASGGLGLGWDGGLWSALWRAGLLLWILPQALLVAWGPGAPPGLPSDSEGLGLFDRVVRTHVDGEQPWDPVADGVLLVVGVAWWAVCLTALGYFVDPDAGVPWTRFGLLGVVGSLVWAAEFDPPPFRSR